MRILVTGGAGYIGSVLVPMLLDTGYEVTVIDNFMYNQTSLSDCIHYRSFSLTKGDARDEKLMISLIKNKDFVIPLACIVGAPACKEDKFAAKTTNLDAILMLLKIRDQQSIIFPDTNSGYGIGQEGIHCDENSPLNPISYYGQLKVDAERAILESGNAVVFRLATVFGISPRMRFDLLVNDFVRRALRDRAITLSEAHFKRNYIHVRDVSRAFIHAIINFESMKNEVYNLGLSDANLSKKELCEEIKKQLPDFHFTEAEILKDVDQRNYIVSNKKIELTGFRPIVSLQEGIAEIIKGYPIFRRENHTNA